jgi:hypothetical protein
MGAISGILSMPMMFLTVVLSQIVWFIPNIYQGLFNFYFSWYYGTLGSLESSDDIASVGSNTSWLNGSDVTSSTFDIQFFLLETFFITLLNCL